jgi:hypothetical protein
MMAVVPLGRRRESSKSRWTKETFSLSAMLSFLFFFNKEPLLVCYLCTGWVSLIWNAWDQSVSDLYFCWGRVLWFEFRVSCWNPASSIFCSGYFGDRVSFFAQASLDHSLLFYASHPGFFFFKMGSTFFFFFAQACLEPWASLSQSPRSLDYRHKPLVSSCIHFRF